MSNQINFVEKEFKESEGGKYDEFGFYHTLNGSNNKKIYQNYQLRFLGY